MAAKTISWIGQQKAAAPEKPFFIYFAPGAAHCPHHVHKEWADRYKGKFDHGWDRQREITFEQQKKLGVIPADAQLTPRPDSIPSWDSRSADEKRLYARFQEVFAGYLEHADSQIGKVVDAIDRMGLTENTLIIYVVGDNGPSAEGSLTGTLNNMKSQAGLLDDIETMVQHIDEIGGPTCENHYPVGWSWAGSSPFQWMKQVASHFGGTRNGLVMSWPQRIKDKGGLRSQFHHAIDIVPTILEAATIAEPFEVNGVPQKPIEGVSMAYSFDSEEAPSRRVTQYFEMFGNRAVYHDGWVAGCRHGRLPWLTGESAGFDDDSWELYNIEDDFTQANDLAAKEPARLRDCAICRIASWPKPRSSTCFRSMIGLPAARIRRCGPAIFAGSPISNIPAAPFASASAHPPGPRIFITHWRPRSRFPKAGLMACCCAAAARVAAIRCL